MGDSKNDPARVGYDQARFQAFLQQTKNYSVVSGITGTNEEKVYQGGFKPKGRITETQKYEAKAPNGMVDISPDKMPLRNEVFNTIREVFKLHGAKELETPVCELKETLTGKYGEDSKLIYDLQDQGGELLSLRYDLTVPFARYLAQYGVDKMRRFHIARVYRRDTARVNKGRFREFYQCDFDAAGVYEDMVPDSECVKIVSQVLDKLNFASFGVQYEIKVNHRCMLDGVFALCGIPPDSFRQICSSVDKLDKEQWNEVRTEMIDGKGLSPEKADLLGKFVSDPNIARDLSQIEKLCQEVGTDTEARKECEKGIAALKKLFDFCDIMNVPKEVIQYDMSMARGLDYYTGVIFEVVLKKDGKLFDVGSVAGGGRYDNLVGMFSKKSKTVPCVGISLGIERLITVLENLRADAKILPPSDIDVFVGSIDFGGFESLPHRLRVCSALWDAGIRAEFAQKKKGDPQFDFCEKERIPIIVYFGHSEWKKSVVIIRKMYYDQPAVDGRIKKEEFTDCPVDQIVTKVKELLRN